MYNRVCTLLFTTYQIVQSDMYNFIHIYTRLYNLVCINKIIHTKFNNPVCYE